MIEATWGALTDYEVVLELMNGAWTLLTAQIILALAFYVYRRARRKPEPPRLVWVLHEHWYHELGTQLAISWLVFSIGSGIARGWAYAYRECANRLDDPIISCVHVTDSVEWLFVASGLAIVGGVCTIRVLLPHEWGAARYVAPSLLSLVPPTAWHVITHWT